ncbi:DUF1059 domain-containing protein [Halorussus halophilus]|uniref:DUF1059 domain-containing protein n=1 Tax=Halorussus halophilus TaxID=2650975 RepID=UPI00130140A1|nr:DUF1059 domain-containing protein [Halorussus halophilus]
MPRQFECFQQGCTFMVRADSDEEIVHLVQEHAQERHGIEINRADIRPEIEEA